MIRAQTREKWLLGERVEYGALSSLAMVEYNLKPIIVGMGLFYPFTKQWDGGSDLISPVLYQKSWTRIKDNGRMFFLRFSWNFHVGRNYQGGKKTLENQSSSSNLSNMPVVD